MATELNAGWIMASHATSLKACRANRVSEMTKKELDEMWSIAMHQSIAAGEQLTRYRFAALVAQKEREACAALYDATASGRDAQAI